MEGKKERKSTGGVMAKLRSTGAAVSSMLFTSTDRDRTYSGSEVKYVPDPDTGKIVVDAKELDFVGARHAAVLLLERLYVVEEESEDEAALKVAMENVVAVLRANPVQRRLVRKKMFYDADLDVDGTQADPRALAGNLKQYIGFCIGPRAMKPLAFTELVVELLAVFLLGACTDTTPNNPRQLETVIQTGISERLGRARAGVKSKKEKREPLEEAAMVPEGTGTDAEIAYAIKCGACELLDFVLKESTVLGVEPFLLGNCSQTLYWAFALYRVLIRADEGTLKHAHDRNLIRTAWDVITRKTKMRDPLAPRIASLKVSALHVLLELGAAYVGDETDAFSINMVNVNQRSIKELVKMLHHYPDLHPTLLTVLTMVGQKESNNIYMKQAGMLEYLTTKVLPFFSAQHQKCIPNLVILLNSWIVTFDDLQFFYQFNGIKSLVFHMKVACGESDNFAELEDGASWEDMLLHGLSILYKLSDSQQYHVKMVTDDCLTVLLECLRVIDPLKSLYHMNSFIAALYSLRNLTTSSLEVRKLVIQNENFVVLCHLLSTPSLPVNCMVHLLFLFNTLVKDTLPRGQPDRECTDLIVNTVFLAVFKPLCKVVQAAPVRQLMDDSQLTILCLALQAILALIQTAKQENPLLCIQIEVELPLESLKYMSNAKSKTPFPELANDVLGMVYLMP